MELDLSVVVITFNMARELPRTIRSLSPNMQRGIAAEQYEIIIVDNGSEPPLDLDNILCWGAQCSLKKMKAASPSPVSALNCGIRRARGKIVGAMIDGARLVSPGLLAGALMASRLHPRPVIASLGFHLGPERQNTSLAKGYNQLEEDRLLNSVGWTDDGYRLFDISVLGGSSAGGFFQPIAESNALFMPAEVWKELGGFDDRFHSPGGGLANLDCYLRACELPNSLLIELLGEGTFHQIHGGVATNSLVHPFEVFQEEYVRIRGKPFAPPIVEPIYFGRIPPQVMTFIEKSAEIALQRREK